MRSKEVRMLVEVAKTDEIAAGGMKAVVANGKEVVLCNYDGRIYAVRRRCGHMNAPLEMGTLEGYILTCPMHHSQFDITTGEALSNPVPRDFGNEPFPENLNNYFQHLDTLMSEIKTYDLETFPVKIEGDSVMVEVK